MSGIYTRNFEEPDDVIELPLARSEIISLGGVSLAHDIQQPGWHWAAHVKPAVGTDWCESHHVGYVMRGRMAVRMRDGTEFEIGPGELMDVPAGHDSWILGDEPFESLAWVGATTWLAPLQTLKDRVLVTLLFTDIVDSTWTARRLGHQRWTDLLRDHDQRMADTVDRYRGEIVKMTGDGFLALFDGAARAMRCAQACHGIADALSLTIRAAVHTGEVQIAGDEIHGLAVHEASRILSFAGPGEVLVSDLTRAFARDSQLLFEDRGEVAMKGLREPTRLHALVG